MFSRIKFLFLLLFAAPLYAAPTVTVTATSASILGTSQSISLTCILTDPNQTGVLRSGANIITVFSTSTVTPAATATCGPLYGNDVITDGFGNASTTYYLIGVYTVHNGIVDSAPSLLQAYQFAGSGTFDLSAILPFSLGPVTPAGTVFGQNLTFNGNNIYNGTSTFNAATTFNAGINSSNFNTFGGIISATANPASSGFQRMAQSDALVWRNAANNGNLSLAPTPQSGNLPADTLNAPQGMSPFFLASPQSNVAAAGFIRIESANSVSWRNNANSADVALAKDTGDRMTWGGQISSAVPNGFVPVDIVAQNAPFGTSTLFAVPAAGQGQYRVSWNAKVTAAAGTSSTLGPLTITYTDVDGVVQTITAAAQIAAGTIATSSAGNTTATVLLGLPITLNCKASTNIQYAFAYAANAANAMQYNLHIRLEAM